MRRASTNSNEHCRLGATQQQQQQHDVSWMCMREVMQPLLLMLLQPLTADRGMLMCVMPAEVPTACTPTGRCTPTATS